MDRFWGMSELADTPNKTTHGETMDPEHTHNH